MKTFFVLVFFSTICFAQYSDALKYFPYKTGDMWEYIWYDPEYPDTLQNFNIKDSIDTDGNIYVWQSARFINPIKPPALLSDTAIYKIDSLFNVFCLTCSFENQFLYKLNANQGDQWVAYTYQDSSNIYGFELVRVRYVWEDYLFGILTTFKNYLYYFTTDSTDTLGLVRFGVTLAKGFGVWWKGGGDAVGQIFLKGCVVNSILYGDTTNIVTSIFDLSENPKNFELYNNYPNPFNPSTTISFDLIKSENISLIVYDLMGRVVRKLIDDDFYYQGSHKITWDGRSDSNESVASGIYFYRLSDYNIKQTFSMILIK